MQYWEAEMSKQGHPIVLTSTREDESAQFFYRKLGYQDCGKLTIEHQPVELFLYKKIVSDQ